MSKRQQLLKILPILYPTPAYSSVLCLKNVIEKSKHLRGNLPKYFLKEQEDPALFSVIRRRLGNLNLDSGSGKNLNDGSLSISTHIPLRDGPEPALSFRKHKEND